VLCFAQDEEDSSDEDGSSSEEEVGGVGGGRAVGGDDDDDKPKASSAVEGLIETANPNAPRKTAVKTADADMDAPQELSRRERCGTAPALGQGCVPLHLRACAALTRRGAGRQ
jgi:hypothetical protein